MTFKQILKISFLIIFLGKNQKAEKAKQNSFMEFQVHSQKYIVNRKHIEGKVNQKHQILYHKMIKITFSHIMDEISDDNAGPSIHKNFQVCSSEFLFT